MKPDSATPQCVRRTRRAAPEAPVRPEAAPPEVLRPKAAAPLRASRRAWLATERRQTRMLRKVAAAPEAPGARSAPDEFLSIYSAFLHLISDFQFHPKSFMKSFIPRFHPKDRIHIRITDAD
jgi:hypothetical protein